MIKTLFLQDRYRLEEIIASEAWINSHREICEKVSFLTVSAGQLKSISSLQTHTEVLAVLALPEYNIDSASWRRVIYLDDVQDPGNVGTILRVADWFGVDAVLRSEQSADFFNPKVIQGSMGSFANLGLATFSWDQLNSFTDNYELPIVVSTLDGASLYAQEAMDRGCLVIGNEGAGIRPEIIDRASRKLQIPGAGGRLADSLNAAVSAGILAASLFGKSGLEQAE